MRARVLKVSQFQQELINMLLLQIVLNKDSILYQEKTMICEYLLASNFLNNKCGRLCKGITQMNILMKDFGDWLMINL